MAHYDGNSVTTMSIVGVDDGGVASSPDDIEAALATVKELIGDGRLGNYKFHIQVSPRMDVNRTTLVAFALLVRTFVTARTDEIGGDPADYVAMLLEHVGQMLPDVLRGAQSKPRPNATDLEGWWGSSG